ncbi:hypothetical protein B0T10DRAFT_545802 [Thelonectria olida]|uniref:Uncharacterized protein n=1 Tax=Thelonectria olida TaxID=1576542 RepID=A0A9P9AVE1_9HYPO|nr:hypothetical protein B0T10DRAFT_545802 [Thelonectria olida]
MSMAASPGSVAGSVRGRSSSLASFGHITDEKDFNQFDTVIPDSLTRGSLARGPMISDSLITNSLIPDSVLPDSVIPNSQATNTFRSAKSLSKKFSLDKEEVSESVLSEGFSWSVKQPPRPGQFTQRQNHQSSQVSGPSQVVGASQVSGPSQVLGASQVSGSSQASDPSQVAGPPLSLLQPSKFLQNIPTSPRLQVNVPRISRPSAPLDLPELGLPGNDVSQRSPPSREPTSNSNLPKKSDSPQQGAPRKTISPTQLPSHRSSPISVHVKSRSRDKSVLLPVYQKSIDLTRDPAEPDQADSKLSQKNVRQTPSQQRLTHRLDDFKLPLSRGGRQSAPQQNAAPSSACGDLERPAPQTPRSSHRPPGETRARVPSRPILSPRQQDRSDRHHDRSQSRASNISRKRDGIRKRRARTDPERKKEAMHHVAQYWNECIRISEDEKMQANLEIEQLQNELVQQEEKLVKTIDLVKAKEALVENAKGRCAELEGQSQETAGENERLRDEIMTLVKQLDESKKQVSELKGKHRTYRNKLNEAISEQQELYTLSCQAYEETRKAHELTREELQNEKASHAAEAKTIEAALETSRQKREEMKSCLEMFQAEADQETRKRNEIVSELEAKVKQQETELMRERESAAELHRRIEDQANVQDKIEKVDLKVQALVKDAANRNVKDENQKEVSGRISSSLDLIMEHLTKSASDATTSTDVQQMTEKLEERIVAKILPAVLTAISVQTQAEESAVSWRDNIHSKLEQMQAGLRHQGQKQSQDQEANKSSHGELRDILSRLDARSNSMETTHEQTMHNMLEWAQNQSSLQRDLTEALRDEITRQMKNRESVINSLEQQLQLVAEDYGNRVEVVRGLILQSDEEAKKHLQDALEAIHNTLANGFNETRDRSEQALSESEAIHASLESCLKKVEQRLAESPHGDHEFTELREALHKEQITVVGLRKQLAQLENESKATNCLREKWRKDIKGIDVLRAQLKDLSGRLPELESVEAKFRNMLQVNQIINSTASYLVAEHTWVSQHLKSTAELAVQDSNIEEAEESQSIAHAKAEATSGPQPLLTRVFSKLKSSWNPSDGTSSREEAARRKVVVESRGNTASLSPPPSIEEEQLQRREAPPPRSILRASQLSSQGSVEEQQHNSVALGQSQFNRRAEGKSSAVVTSGKQEMIDQIRSGLVQPKPTRKGWVFPTVADFERDAQIGRHDMELMGKKHAVTITDQDEGPNAKRVKTDGEASQMVPGVATHRPQPHPVKRQRALLTYSGKSTNVELRR